MKRTRWILIAVLAALLLGGGYGVLAWMNRPMSQALTLQTPTQDMAQTVGQTIPEQVTASVDKMPAPAVAMPAATQILPPTESAKICGSTGSMNLMVLGLTTPTEDDPLGADAIRLVNISFDQPSATIMTLPAMVWVDTSRLTDLGVKESQLNLLYLKAYLAAKDDPEEVREQKAIQAMAQTILDNFGFISDHYLVMNEGAVIKYVDNLGGIEINLPKPVDGTHEGYGIYPAGPQHLNGTRTLNFARLFYPGGTERIDVWGNLERQNLVVKGILAATLKPQNLTKIPSLMKEVRQAVISDLSLNQTLDLACMVGKVGESARMLVIGEDMVSMDSLGRMIPDKEAIKGLVAEMDGEE